MSVASKGLVYNLQPLLSINTSNGNSATIETSNNNHVITVKGAGTITSGTISIEEADDENYTGTWSVVFTVTASDVTAGAAKAIHITGAFRALRARISVAIGGGGSISADLVSDMR